jgi:hypothetical protein
MVQLMPLQSRSQRMRQVAGKDLTNLVNRTINLSAMHQPLPISIRR